MNDQEIEDGVIVPRSLLGSARYAILQKFDAPNTYAKLGEYVYPNGNTADIDVLLAADEQLSTLQADRDIKAANLKMLVDMVLDHEAAVERAAESGGDGGDVFETEELRRELIALARGLKQ